MMRVRLPVMTMAGAAALALALVPLRAQGGKTTWDGVYSQAQAEKGSALFMDRCAKCHGPAGEGTAVAPPLWGSKSYNVGAGMARVRTAAEFIRNNMPFDQAGTLTNQQAIDVAAFVSARPRPDYRGKELDWPNGDPPPDVAYATAAAQRKAHSAPGRSP